MGSIGIAGLRGRQYDLQRTLQQEERKVRFERAENIALAGIATSMDALVIGGSLSLAGQGWSQTVPQAVSVFICTALSVLVGILCGGKLARKAGRWAEGIGGVVLIGIGLSIVL